MTSFKQQKRAASPFSFAITPETFIKATQKAQAVLKDNKGGEFAEALDFASNEARSVVLRSKIGGQNPQVKIEKNTKATLAEAKRNIDLVAQLIAKMGSQSVVSYN